MGYPVRRCSSPKSLITSVPEYGLLQSTFSTPIPSQKAFTTDFGKPSGNVGKGLLSWIPAISQCPVVESLPADTSLILPQDARGFFAAPTEARGFIFPRPSFPKLGSLHLVISHT